MPGVVTFKQRSTARTPTSCVSPPEPAGSAEGRPRHDRHQGRMQRRHCGACTVVLDGRIVDSSWSSALRSRAARSRPSRGWHRRAGCTPCSNRSWKTPPSSAASAPPASWSPRAPLLTPKPDRGRGARSATGWPGTLPLHSLDKSYEQVAVSTTFQQVAGNTRQRTTM